jgi:hypothetical protein
LTNSFPNQVNFIQNEALRELNFGNADMFDANGFVAFAAAEMKVAVVVFVGRAVVVVAKGVFGIAFAVNHFMY